jgi:hypothetical protein
MGCAKSKPIIQINVVEPREKIFLTREEFTGYKSFHQLLTKKNIVSPTSGYRIYVGDDTIDPYSSVRVYEEIKIRIFDGTVHVPHRTLQMLTLYRR